MNITSKNRTFIIMEESCEYSFGGDFMLNASGLVEFRGNVVAKAEDRMGSVFYNETGNGEMSVSFSGP